LLGNLSVEVLCDVVPVHILSCHLLLGRPWYNVQGAVYHMDDAYNYVQYSVPYGNKTYNLLSMDIKLYRTWRDDRLQKKKDEEDAKKKEVEAEAILTRPTQSRDDVAALETDSKPRTVSPEVREDDMAPDILYVTSDTVQLNIGVLHGFCGHRCMPNNSGQFWLHACTKEDTSAGESNCNHVLFDLFAKEAWRDRFQYYYVSSRSVLFLFLPRKEKASRRSLLQLRELYSLCNLGWGPPAMERLRRWRIK
jgi:hypothetical protein